MHLIEIWWHYFSIRYLLTQGRLNPKTHPDPEKVKMNSFCYFLPYIHPDGIRAYYGVFEKCPV